MKSIRASRRRIARLLSLTSRATAARPTCTWRSRSGVPSLDQSAMRAIQRIDSFGKLPEGDNVTVEFWFDYPPK